MLYFLIQFAASTSRAMNSKGARNRTISESAVIHGKHAASTPLVFDQEVAVVGNKLVHLQPQEQPQAKVYSSGSQSSNIGRYCLQRLCCREFSISNFRKRSRGFQLSFFKIIFTKLEHLLFLFQLVMKLIRFKRKCEACEHFPKEKNEDDQNNQNILQLLLLSRFGVTKPKSQGHSFDG
ncbi:hypothetical protein ANCCAN_24552 [Ancylostoma caninum]|uniref:Uncharacterized protein n=1 Tax=Ancylostoma caninum TaxID=29170 RepID=A0A368FFN5_ANCCA|nr:hypothetical protein ANCCAN_24552 [Ancylostoma caninum]